MKKAYGLKCAMSFFTTGIALSLFILLSSVVYAVPDVSYSTGESTAGCHEAGDVGYYKINWGAAYSHKVSAVLYDKANPVSNSNYMPDTGISYWPDNGTLWNDPKNTPFPDETLPEELLYLKIEPNDRGIGSHTAKTDIAADCYTSFTDTGVVTSSQGTHQIDVETGGPSCSWTAFSNDVWIMIISEASGRGTGTIRFSYTENTTMDSRTGTITINNRTYTVTQAPPSDEYEPNNTVGEAHELNGTFAEGVSTISTTISPANCHAVGDVDYYKINLETGYSYTLGAVLYDRSNNSSSYTLEAKISYSTDNCTTWRQAEENVRFSGVPMQGGVFYLKIEPSSSYGERRVGSYAAKIDINKIVASGCTYSLPANKIAIMAAGTGKIMVTPGTPSCYWAAFSNDKWITITSGASGTGTGEVSYSYNANMAAERRAGTITVAGQTYTVTQEGRPLTRDEYEPNNTVEEAGRRGGITAVFTPENTSTITILQATCHNSSDVDYYKINLGTGTDYSYKVSAVLYDHWNQTGNSNYTLDAKISYSTDNGTTWSNTEDVRFSGVPVQGVILYLKVEPNDRGIAGSGSYAAKIDILKTAVACTYNLSPGSKQAASAAGSDQVTVTTDSTCPWAAVSNAPWITLTSAPITTGRGSVQYSYTENTETSTRTGTITIADKTYTLTQLPRPITSDGYEENNTVGAAYSFTPVFTQNTSTITISPANCHTVEDVDYYKINLETGYSYTLGAVLYDRYSNHNSYTLVAQISYSTDNGTTWKTENTRFSGVPMPAGGPFYLKIVPFSGYTGSYAVKIDIAKGACVYTFSPANKQVSPAASIGQVTMKTGSTCAWTAVSDAPWLTVTPETGTGTGTITYSYTENTAATPREGTITAGGQTFVVTQVAAGTCFFTFTPGSATALSALGTGSVTITPTLVTCAWQAASNVPWLTITPTTGTGSGVVSYSYNANMAVGGRTGIITVGSQTYTVTQAGLPLTRDEYEPNNTVETAWPFTPVFTQNKSTVTISSATCHETGSLDSGDIDYYKINLGARYSYKVSAVLYNKTNQISNSNYTLEAKISYSTDNGTTWSYTYDTQFLGVTVPGGVLHLKIEPYNYREKVGSYAAKIDITAGCYSIFPEKSKVLTSPGGTHRINVTTGSSCSWTASSGDAWLTLTSGSGTGTGTIGVSYTENTTMDSRTGSITLDDQTYTLTQAPPSDKYEPNNTVEDAHGIMAAFTPQNVSTITLSPAGCHTVEDVDYYKINLEAGYSYRVSGVLYDQNNPINNSNYRLEAKISYSTDKGITWKREDTRFSGVIVPAGELFYLKIEPRDRGNVGSYAAKIDINRTAAAGCTYSLTANRSTAVMNESTGKITVRASTSSCYWAAFSNDTWITITSGASSTGSGEVSYSYNANMAAEERTGTITVAGQTYTVTQAGRPLTLDEYEENNTAGTAYLFTPEFTQNKSTVTISPANCHNNSDVDYYKINLGAGTGYSYKISAVLYDYRNQTGNSNYTLNAQMSYLTDNGTTWSSTYGTQFSGVPVPGGAFYLKIEPAAFGWSTGSYAAKIDILKIASGCTYNLGSESRPAASAAGSDQVTVTTSSSCPWAAVSNDSWITLTSAPITTGRGSVQYSYTENTETSTRTGTITIAGKTYTLTQLPRPITSDGYEENNTAGAAYSFTPVFTQNKSTVTISPANCHTVEDVDYYKINLAPGYSYTAGAVLYDRYSNRNNYTLDAQISYSTDNGTTWSEPADRQFSGVTVSGETLYLKIEPYLSGKLGSYAAKIDITIASCTYNLSPASKQVTSAANSDQITVTTGSTCAWTATSDAPSWLTITPDTGTGTGSITYSYTENTETESRSGIITIAGQTCTVTQQGRTCAYKLKKYRAVVGVNASAGMVNVETESPCVWNATSNNDWIVVTENSKTGKGNGTVSYSIAKNTGKAERIGSITIAGRFFTVTQSMVTGFETTSHVEIFPNPAREYVTLEFSSTDKNYASLKIANQIGQVLYERENPQHKMQIPLKGFASGLYFIILQGGEKAEVQKLIVE